MRTRVAAALVLLPLSALGSQSPSGDTTFVRSTAAPIWGTAVTLTRVFSIGTTDGPPEYSFGTIASIAVDRTGRFYLYDSKDTLVRAYDASGKFLRQIGRHGDGPDEYPMVLDMDVASDSLLAIYTSRSQVKLFRPSGEMHSAFRDARLTHYDDGWFAADRQGVISIKAQILARGVPREASEMPGAIVGAHYLLFRDGRLIDSLRVPPTPLPPPTFDRFYLMLAEGSTVNFAFEAFTAPLPGVGLIYGTNDRYRFGIKSMGGAVRIVERPWTPVSLREEERANWLEWAAYMRRRDAADQIDAQRRYDIPRTKPAYKSLFGDRDGRIWVSLHSDAEKRSDIAPRTAGDPRPLLVWRQRAVYDVYSRTGAYLGRVTLPHNARVVAAQGNRIWVLSKDADDIESITVYVIDGATS